MSEMDRLEESRLRALWALGARPPGPHLDEAAWGRLAGGLMEIEERRRALDHITRCADCALIYKALSRLEAKAREFDPGAPAAGLTAPPRSSRPSRHLWWAGLAAAAALLLFVALPTNGPRQGPEPRPDPRLLRADADVEAPRPLDPTGTITAPPNVLRWQGVPGARAYRVELLSAEGEPLWHSEAIEGTSLDWPDAVPVQQGRYYWRVRTLPAAGSDPTVSELVAFDLALEAP